MNIAGIITKKWTLYQCEYLYNECNLHMTSNVIVVFKKGWFSFLPVCTVV